MEVVSAECGLFLHGTKIAGDDSLYVELKWQNYPLQGKRRHRVNSYSNECFSEFYLY